VGGYPELFEPVDKRWKLFRRKSDAGVLRALPQIPLQRSLGDEAMPAGLSAGPAVKEAHFATQIQRTLLNRFAPTSVVVNDKADIVYIHGRTGTYLEPTPGQPRHNVVDMAREGLQIEISSAVRECIATNADVLRENIRVKTNGSFVYVNLTVSKIKEPESVRGLLLISFRPSPSALPVQTKAKKGKKRTSEDERVASLERELQHTKESHQTTQEELETTNEELKSANEELQSINEELQSTNEELETSKEEMQSLNEELTTVNTELQSKVEELSQANDDMQNLLNSTDIATVFLDNALNIKRFTKQAKELVMLRETDVGRPISELASNLYDNTLIADCGAVLKTLGSRESEVRTKDGGWYLMRIMPYRTAENVIEGLVLTFVDVHGLKEAHKELSRMLKVFMASVDPVFIIDLEGKVANLNDEAVRTYGFSREQMLGKPVISLIVAPERQKQISELIARSRGGELIRDVQEKLVNKVGEKIQRVLTLAPLMDDQGKPDAVAIRTTHDGQL
jgi:two-component system CheB/CheR fusion protein